MPSPFPTLCLSHLLRSQDLCDICFTVSAGDTQQRAFARRPLGTPRIVMLPLKADSSSDGASWGGSGMNGPLVHRHVGASACCRVGCWESGSRCQWSRGGIEKTSYSHSAATFCLPCSVFSMCSQSPRGLSHACLGLLCCPSACASRKPACFWNSSMAQPAPIMTHHGSVPRPSRSG